MYDIGGHELYVFLHSLFISKNTGIVLTVNLNDYEVDKHHNMVGRWHQSPICETEGASAVVVGTHGDLCPDGGSHKLSLLKETIQNEREKTIQYLSDQIDRYRETAEQEELVKLQKQKEFYQHFQPKVIKATADGRKMNYHDVENLRKEILEYFITNVHVWSKKWKSIHKKVTKVTSKADAILKLKTLKGKSMSLFSSSKKQFYPCLEYLHDTREIVWYYSHERLKKFVMTDPVILIQLLKKLFTHNMDQQLVYSTNQTIYDGKSMFNEDKKRYTNEGFLSRRLFDYILRDEHLSKDQMNYLIDLMCHHNICFTAEKPEDQNDSSFLHFPWITSNETPVVIVKEEGEVEITMVFSFFLYLPVTVYEQFVVRSMYHFSHDKSKCVLWKRGLYIKEGELQCAMQKSERSSEKEYPDIRIQVRCPPGQINEAWDTCSNLAREMYSLLEKVPHLPKNTYYICPHCVLHGYESMHCPGGKILLTLDDGGKLTGTCKQHEDDKHIPTLLLVPVHPGKNIFI